MSTTTPIPGRRTRTTRPSPSHTAVGYLRVSTTEQAASGAGLDAQREAVQRHADRHGLTVTEWFTDAGVSGGIAPDNRPGMSAALDALRDRRAGVMVAAKLDRVSRSVRDAAELIDRATAEGWALRTADGTVGDDDSPMGRAMIGVASVFSELERGLIATRTREALAARKAAGVTLGRPTTLPQDVLRRIITELSEGRSLRAICDGLMIDGIPTATGNPRWHPAQVKRAADSDRGRAMAAQMFPTTDEETAA